MPPTDESDDESNQHDDGITGPSEGDHRDETPTLDSVLKLLATLPLDDPHKRNMQLEKIFDRHRIRLDDVASQQAESSSSSLETARILLEPILETWLHHWNQDVLNNAAGGSAGRVRPYLLRSLPLVHNASPSTPTEAQASSLSAWVHHQYPEYFAIVRRNHRMKWQDEWDAMGQRLQRGPIVDYTSPDKYVSPPIPAESEGPAYPQLQPLGELLENWKQNDDQPGTIQETLVHLDYANSQHVAMAALYRRAGIPFKVVNVPDVAAAQLKWTDEYLSSQFDVGRQGHGLRVHSSPSSIGAVAIESTSNLFVPYEADKWDIFRLGPAPTRQVTDWTYAQWSRHAQYADAVRLGSDQPHFVWQSRAGHVVESASDPPLNGSFVSQDVRVHGDNV
jgi:hypothetical protein